MPQFPSTTSAKDIWSLTDQKRAQAGSNWPLITGPEIYSFTSFTFTNAGVQGTSGPTLSQCLAGYNTTTYSWLNDTGFFNVVTQGIQLWTVPATASYTIEAAGAKGGNSSYGSGGKGARIIGTFTLNSGEKLRILVGQEAVAGSLVGGGGGGTFVMKATGTTNSDIYVIAGGGGGAQYGSYRSPESQIDGQSGTTSGAGWNGGGGNISLNNGQTNGSGGICYDRSGGGGGGLNGNGGTSTYVIGGSNGTGGYSFSNGGAAYPGTSYPGGFGGGGSGDWVYWTGGGGGGGYAGGSGGYYYGNGGGGASYNNGTNQTNTAGYNTGQGYVIITKLQ